MAMRTLLAGLDDPALPSPDDFRLHNVGANWAVRLIDASSRCLQLIFLFHREYLAVDLASGSFDVHDRTSGSRHL